jgi:hypothetical protein
MANKSIITNGAYISQVEQVYFAPSAVVPPNIDIPLSSLYCFLAQVQPWEVDSNPPVPQEDVKSQKQIFKNIFAARKITTNDISPVVQRINWESGTTYDYYRDDVNMVEFDENGKLVKSFYVKNRYDQVFKCIWNNSGEPSTIEPYFEPGSYNTNNVFQSTDGYKWKYIYTIDAGLRLKFMDNTWMPVPVGTNTPNPFNASKAGSIDVINVVDGGSLYDPANAVIYVTVTGDGTGATGVAVVNEGENKISDIVVTNPGTNYTYANVAITSSLGFGASAIAPTSPIGGHGFDPISELGCKHVMMSAEFNGAENGIIPTDINYHQVGLLINPTLNSLSGTGYPASGDLYRTTTEFLVSPGFNAYTSGEVIFQGDTLETASFFGTVLSFDVASNVIQVLNMSGTPTFNAQLRGVTSKTSRTLLKTTPPDFAIFSGYISYIENRAGIQRSTDGIEQFKFVLGF